MKKEIRYLIINKASEKCKEANLNPRGLSFILNDGFWHHRWLGSFFVWYADDVFRYANRDGRPNTDIICQDLLHNLERVVIMAPISCIWSVKTKK